MRCDPKPVAWGELFASSQVGVAGRVFGDDLAAMGDRDDTAGPLRRAHLKFDPTADVSDRGRQPWFHVRDLQECRMIIAIEDGSTIRQEWRWLLTDEIKPAQTF